MVVQKTIEKSDKALLSTSSCCLLWVLIVFFRSNFFSQSRPQTYCMHNLISRPRFQKLRKLISVVLSCLRLFSGGTEHPNIFVQSLICYLYEKRRLKWICKAKCEGSRFIYLSLKGSFLAKKQNLIVNHRATFFKKLSPVKPVREWKMQAFILSRLTLIV